MASTTLEKATEDLELDKIYKEYFKTSGKSKYESECDAINKGKPDDAKAKELCKKLLYFLEKIASLPKKTENADRCSYLRYWLYDEIGKIQTKHSTKISQIPFVKDLFVIGNKVNDKIKTNTCVLPNPENNIDLDEWKKRKLSYIYFENYDKIKQLSSSNDKAKCKKYSEYVKSFNTLFEKYKKDHCDGRSKSTITCKTRKGCRFNICRTCKGHSSCRVTKWKSNNVTTYRNGTPNRTLITRD
ncbi:hypothetical protein PVBG_00577 [Plasmodium vivax Brazil I]|uniref:Variable surface protein Vir12 n=1 Tax=Plasmodium vivax (strain Brazil I) TaxID=1033975 RepID=A0A0J9SKD0_PLAV1|nr:hypothetical protein PVBG_00577 [Plasmodium vivax Brazil I]